MLLIFNLPSTLVAEPLVIVGFAATAFLSFTGYLLRLNPRG